MLALWGGIGNLLRTSRYSGPEKFAVETIDVPAIGDDDVLVGFVGFHAAASRVLTCYSRSRFRLVVYAELYVLHHSWIFLVSRIDFFLERICTIIKANFSQR